MDAISIIAFLFFLTTILLLCWLYRVDRESQIETTILCLQLYGKDSKECLQKVYSRAIIAEVERRIAEAKKSEIKSE